MHLIYLYCVLFYMCFFIVYLFCLWLRFLSGTTHFLIHFSRFPLLFMEEWKGPKLVGAACENLLSHLIFICQPTFRTRGFSEEIVADGHLNTCIRVFSELGPS